MAMSETSRIGNPKNIVFLHDLLSDIELSAIREFCASATDWKSSSYDGSKDMGIGVPNDGSLVATSLLNATQTIRENIEEHFGRELSTQYPNIRKWESGDSQPLHADGEDLEGKPNEAYSVDYASVIYLNDDYDGGELCFPLQGIRFKPIAGTAAFFPANRWYRHSVSEISNGTRYTSPQFWVPVKHSKLKEFYAKR